MEEKRDIEGPVGQGSSNSTWWSSEIVEKFGSVSLGLEESLTGKNSPRHLMQDWPLSQRASHTLWRTRMLSEPIPNGFYSFILDKRIKERFDSIPTLEELHALEEEGLKPDIILVDFHRDKKLIKLKQLTLTLARGLSSNPAAMIRKIAGVVFDVYKRPTLEESSDKAILDENTQSFENRGVQMLGQIKHGSCRPRAILFKVLADSVGLESSLAVGLPSDEPVECVDSDKDLAVMVVVNSLEFLVDLMRFPGKLIPRSAKAIYMTHKSAAVESDFAENDSCESPLEPNSPLTPLYGYSERRNVESAEKDEILPFQGRSEGSPNVSGPSLQNSMLRPVAALERSLSFSHSEPNIATEFWRRSQRRVIAEQRTASSSPEHPSYRGRRRSLLSGDRNSLVDFRDNAATSSYKSDGTSTPKPQRVRRRSISSITPEIGDDIARFGVEASGHRVFRNQLNIISYLQRAVRAMSEAMKQNRLLHEHGNDISYLHHSDGRNDSPDFQKNLDVRDQVSGNGLFSHLLEQANAQKAISLPSSPHKYMSQTSERSRPPDYSAIDMWNKVLESPKFQNKPLLPYEEWNMDFSELTVGTRVGIGFFGEVFRGIWNGTTVAIKVFLEQDLTAENIEDFCNEISILSRLRHPNVILFMGACTKPPRLSMVTEYMEMGSLYYLIHSSGQKKKLTWLRKLKMLRDICRGLMCMHRMKIVHRDLKSANCLVNKHWTVKICDFGLSRIMADTSMKDSASAGTPEWMAPELIRNEPFTEKCDIFSLGVIMWELVTLSRPWEGVPPQKVVNAVANEGSRLEIPESPLGQLIRDCWGEPQERPNCEEILSRLVECEHSVC